MADVLPSYADSAARADAGPSYHNDSQDTSRNDRIPTYEGAVHGALPTSEQVTAYIHLVDGFNAFLKTLNYDPEGLYIYLATAEQRYLQFLKMRPHSNFLPPMDVALIWLVHLNDPFRYWEDMFRSYQGMLEIEFPVEKLAEKFSSKLLSSRTSADWSDDKHGRDIWESQTNSPYRLSTNRDTLEKRVVMCPLPAGSDPECLMLTARQWALMMKYPEMSFKHAESDKEFSAASISVSRFLHNIRHRVVVKGSTMSDGSIDYTASLARQDRLFEFPELQAILVADQPTWDKVRLAMRFVVVKNKLQGTTDEIKPIAWEVCHRSILTNLGLCLPDAVLRSVEAWKVLLRARDLKVSATIDIYKDYLALFVNQRNILVPTTGIEIVLRTHLLAPQSYRAYTYGILGRHLAHDDTQSVAEFGFHLDTTRRLWTTKYPQKGRFDESTSGLSKLKGKFSKKKEEDASREAYRVILSSYELCHESMLPARGTDADLRGYREFLNAVGLKAPIAGQQPDENDAMLYSQIKFGLSIPHAGGGGVSKLELLQQGKVRPHGMHVSHNNLGMGLTHGVMGGSV